MLISSGDIDLNFGLEPSSTLIFYEHASSKGSDDTAYMRCFISEKRMNQIGSLFPGCFLGFNQLQATAFQVKSVLLKAKPLASTEARTNDLIYLKSSTPPQSDCTL